ncbi:hypothetical protein GGR56DRAFT_665192 [Xylariaceae sp. FL0804]|nr:hypothetical protein GGR56DRAFT_665192 [Xylariaceae sp. FL0804]
MDDLPSYGEATTRLDWLDLVAAYVPVASWPRCCLVNRRFYQRFAPRLWQDPLVVIRSLGLHPNDDLAWYRRFVNKHVKSARIGTRCLVRSLDFRGFALRASGLYSTEASERAISESLRSLPSVFPMLIALLLDGHPEIDPSSLAISTAQTDHSLQLLDLAHCRQELSSKLFGFDSFRNLVYLDVSSTPGSLRSPLQSSLNPRFLPDLRILKARGREVDDSTASLLFRTFGRQLWSLDISSNKLTDVILDEIVDRCFSSLSFRTDAHFDREGKLALPREIGSQSHGPFYFIEESQSSAAFRHPERYLSDAPVYARRRSQTELQEWQVVRSDGLGPLRPDDAESVKRMLLEDNVAQTTGMSWKVHDRLRRSRGGLTHLYLNGNSFTSAGIDRLLRTSSGRLEHFECDSCISPRRQHDGERYRVRPQGLLRAAHLFRPVVSSNLRSLRVHHSVVTQVPTLRAEGLPISSALRLAEESMFRNVRRIYPSGSFEPDMNPRIVSITLTNIPARSTGPVIGQITRFLDLASMQQRAIESARAAPMGRGPSVLRGLRHIRLEIEPDFSEDTCDSLTGDEVDLDKLLDPGDDDFGVGALSFFGDESQSVTSRSRGTGQPGPSASGQSVPNSPVKHYEHWKSGRLQCFPYSDIQSESMIHHPQLSQSWSGNTYSVPVWVGPGTIGPHAAVNEYMWNLQDPELRRDVGPATPYHVAAGVPPSSYVFNAAWDAMVWPRQHLQAAVRDSGCSAPWRDVAAAIKEHRLRRRGTPDHWDGQIELARASEASRYHSSEYWR